MKKLFYYMLPVLVAGILSWKLATGRLAVQEAVNPGLEVYLGEGCIHCHSQYSRPVGVDPSIWGSTTDADRELDKEIPVVFGNRRQGPDLSNVGIRRSREWNRIHLIDPQAVRPGSRMPAYAHLFSGDHSRGDALLDYLQSLGGEAGACEQRISDWSPKGPLFGGNPDSGQKLFSEYCASCHGMDGSGNGALAGQFNPAPRNLQLPSAWQWTHTGSDPEKQRIELARLIKFGHPGSSMAGTEWLTEEQITNLIRFIRKLQQDSP